MSHVVNFVLQVTGYDEPGCHSLQSINLGAYKLSIIVQLIDETIIES